MDRRRICHSKSLEEFSQSQFIEFDLPTTSSSSQIQSNDSHQGEKCMVCGDGGAKMHYGISACLGCKGFFRRALKRANEYECLKNRNCVINKYERNSCRYCRLQKCLQAGMDPASVRPDRDFTGRQSLRTMAALNRQQQRPRQLNMDTVNSDASPPKNEDLNGTIVLGQRPKSEQTIRASKYLSSNDWVMRLPVDVRTMLMTLLNIEAKVVRGDTSRDASELYPLGISTIREIITDPMKLHGRRTKIRYEPYRMADNKELSIIVYRRLIAAIDWVEALSEMIDSGLDVEDKITLVKSSFGPLALFKASARTSMVTERDDLLCLCNFSYVPRNIAKAYSDTYHLDNGLVGRLIDQLVLPFRKIHLKDEECVCLSAIIVLNPMAKDLSKTAAEKVGKLRERINDTLYQIVKESRKEEYSAVSSQFGNLLLYIPIVTDCANSMNENLRFAQTFSSHGGIPLLTSLFGCFPVEPFLESEFKLASIVEQVDDDGINTQQNKNGEIVVYKNVETQTEDGNNKQAHGIKRHFPAYFTSSVENESTNDFMLLQPPCSYTLTEMFDDRSNNYDSPIASRQSFSNTPADSSPSTPVLLQSNPETVVGGAGDAKEGPSMKRLFRTVRKPIIARSSLVCNNQSNPAHSKQMPSDRIMTTTPHPELRAVTSVHVLHDLDKQPVAENNTSTSKVSDEINSSNLHTFSQGGLSAMNGDEASKNVPLLKNNIVSMYPDKNLTSYSYGSFANCNSQYIMLQQILPHTHTHIQPGRTMPQTNNVTFNQCGLPPMEQQCSTAFTGYANSAQPPQSSIIPNMMTTTMNYLNRSYDTGMCYPIQYQQLQQHYFYEPQKPTTNSAEQYSTQLQAANTLDNKSQ